MFDIGFMGSTWATIVKSQNRSQILDQMIWPIHALFASTERFDLFLAIRAIDEACWNLMSR